MSPTAARSRAKKSKSEKPAEGSSAPAPAGPPPPRHMLVPDHEVLSAEEGRKVLAELETPTERLPKILLDDPGLATDAKFRAAREAKEELVGRLVRVRRPSPTAGETVAYRVIIAAAGE
jgi:DNA-directed RNA polymerase subunit H